MTGLRFHRQPVHAGVIHFAVQQYTRLRIPIGRCRAIDTRSGAGPSRGLPGHVGAETERQAFRVVETGEPHGKLDFRARILGFCRKRRAFRAVLPIDPCGNLDFGRRSRPIGTRSGSDVASHVPGAQTAKRVPTEMGASANLCGDERRKGRAVRLRRSGHGRLRHPHLLAGPNPRTGKKKGRNRSRDL